MALILIADDSLTTREAISKLLKSQGHETMEAVDGSEALKMVGTHGPDCIVLDLIMPVLGGLEVLKVLHDQGSKIPVVVLTADIQDVVQEECMELGAVAYVNKPMIQSELCDAIKKAVSLKKETLNESDPQGN